MKKEIYVTLDSEKRITGYGKAEYGVITGNPEESILVSLPDDHEFLQGNSLGYKLVGGNLVKDLGRELKQLKEKKKTELKSSCQSHILSGFDFSLGELTYHISYDREAQLNFAERWNLFQNNMIDSIMLTVKTIPEGEVKRILVNKDEFTIIYLDSIKHKENCISRLQDLLIPMVNNAVSLKQLADIDWTNISLFPGEPSVEVKDDATLAKGVETAEAKADLAQNSSELTTMALMEAMGVLFGGTM